MNENERLLTTQEVAEYLRAHPETVRKWIRSGQLRAIKFGRRGGFKVRLADLERFKAARATIPEGEEPDTQSAA